MSILANRHDFLLLFEVTNGNPNGDPDAGNMPRLDPNTNRGLVTDVCLKRKVRNFLDMFPPARDNDSTNRNSILVKQGAVIETEQKRGIAAAKEPGSLPGAPVRCSAPEVASIAAAKEPRSLPGATHAERTKNWLCREFFDVRTFGGVLSTGDDVMKGSAFGQVRGPVQFTFGQSFHPITPLEVTISVCAARMEAEDKGGKPATEEEIAKNAIAQTGIQGRKHIVPYGLYAAKGYISPAFAEKTGFTDADLELLFQAILSMFEHDRSAARGEMIVRGLYDFEHVGTQLANNAAQNLREARLGCAHAHTLIEGIKVDLTAEAKAAGTTFPESFTDYAVVNTWTAVTLPKGIKLHLRHEVHAVGTHTTVGPKQG